MDDKIKILLGDKNTIDKSIGDIFINVGLESSFQELKKEVINNNFDLQKQFNKERNTSRNFIVYGTVDAPNADTRLISLDLYGITTGGTYILLSSNTLTTDLISTSFGACLNAYNRKRGKYLFQLDSLQQDIHDIEIRVMPMPSIGIKGQTFQQKLVFFNPDGQFIEYGTETIDVSDNATLTEVNNNFPFLYNIHWVKKDLNLVDIPLKKITFTNPSYTGVKEGDTINIEVKLDSPSELGAEVFQITSHNSLVGASYVNSADYSINPPLNTNIYFSIGEQTKNIELTILNDIIVENVNELLMLTFVNKQNLANGQYVSTVIYSEDNTNPSLINYNFRKASQTSYDTNGSEVVLQNGFDAAYLSTGINEDAASGLYNKYLKFINYINVSITNLGENTVLPSGIPGNTSNFPAGYQFLANQTINTPLILEFQTPTITNTNSIPVEQVKVSFPNTLTYARVWVNGIQVWDEYMGPLDHTNFPVSTEYGSDTGPDYVLLIASSPSLLLNVIVEEYNDIDGTVTSMSHLIEKVGYAAPDIEQIPFVLPLYGNDTTLTKGKYKFEIHGIGHKPITINNEVDTAVSADVYLTTGIKNIQAPNVNNPCGPASVANLIDTYYFDGVALIFTDSPTEYVFGEFLAAPMNSTCSNNVYGYAKNI